MVWLSLAVAIAFRKWFWRPACSQDRLKGCLHRIVVHKNIHVLRIADGHMSIYDGYCAQHTDHIHSNICIRSIHNLYCSCYWEPPIGYHSTENNATSFIIQRVSGAQSLVSEMALVEVFYLNLSILPSTAYSVTFFRMTNYFFIHSLASASS